MQARTLPFLLIALATGIGEVAAGTVLTFEGVVPPGDLINVAPGYPWDESGFELSSSDGSSAVFADGYTLYQFPGDSTAWFGFSGSNLITLTNLSGTPFSLISLLIGPAGEENLVNVTLVGHLSGGGIETQVFKGLTTATLESVNWSNLSSVVINTTGNAGMDNIALNSTPEPPTIVSASIALLLAIIAGTYHKGRLPGRSQAVARHGLASWARSRD